MRKVRGGKLTPPNQLSLHFSNFNFKPVEFEQVEKVVADVIAQIALFFGIATAFQFHVLFIIVNE